jgi:hypothetical protein
VPAHPSRITVNDEPFADVLAIPVGHRGRQTSYRRISI